MQLSPLRGPTLQMLPEAKARVLLKSFQPLEIVFRTSLKIKTAASFTNKSIKKSS